MIRCGKTLVLNYDDVVEGLLNGAVLSIPEGSKELMIKCDAVERLNADLGFTDAEEEES